MGSGVDVEGDGCANVENDEEEGQHVGQRSEGLQEGAEEDLKVSDE